MKLSQINEGQNATVRCLETCGSIRRRLLDLGLIEGTKIQCVQLGPCGDPIAYLIRGALIALRREDAETILVSPEVI